MLSTDSYARHWITWTTQLCALVRSKKFNEKWRRSRSIVAFPARCVPWAIAGALECTNASAAQVVHRHRKACAWWSGRSISVFLLKKQARRSFCAPLLLAAGPSPPHPCLRCSMGDPPGQRVGAGRSPPNAARRYAQALLSPSRQAVPAAPKAVAASPVRRNVWPA